MKDEAHLVISHIDHMSHVIKPSLFITMTLTSIGKIRGPASKTELSLVDKIELARAYQDITGKRNLLGTLFALDICGSG